MLFRSPWSFDKYIMALQRYDKDVDLCDMDFNLVTFWVQVHDIPRRFRTSKVVEKICSAIGTTCEVPEGTEVEGDGFIWVRVTVDISQPLCRGRVISVATGKEQWVSFKYEHLPNMCYWCGCLTHVDRDCELWIDSKGTLQSDSQQFGPWLRAAPFTATRKNVVVVLGFYSKKNGASSSMTHSKSTKNPPVVMVVRTGGPAQEIIRPEMEREGTAQPAIIIPDVQEDIGGLSNPGISGQPTLHNSKFSNLIYEEKQVANELFEAKIQEIDRDLCKFELIRETVVQSDHITNKENILEFATSNERPQQAKVYTHAALAKPLTQQSLSPLSDVSNYNAPHEGRWKRIARVEWGSNTIMEEAMVDKRTNRDGESQPELLKVRRLVSQVDKAQQMILVSLLCWNCRGLGNQRTENQLANIVWAKDPSVVFLAETWTDETRLIQIHDRLQLKNEFIALRRNKTGGLVIFWKKDFDLNIETFSHNHIDITINKVR